MFLMERRSGGRSAILMLEVRLIPPVLDDVGYRSEDFEPLVLRVKRFMADPEWLAFQPKWD